MITGAARASGEDDGILVLEHAERYADVTDPGYIFRCIAGGEGYLVPIDADCAFTCGESFKYTAKGSRGGILPRCCGNADAGVDPILPDFL